MNARHLAILAALTATTIYGINHTVAKGVMPTHVQPFAFIFLRVGGAAILFWIISLFGPKEKVVPKDWKRFLLCALLGMCINMLAFFKGLELSTPINSAVMITISPIIVVVLSALLIKERITFIKGTGVLLGLTGALTLTLFGAELRQDAPNIPLGNFLFIVNATSYGCYLIAVRPLLKKYHPFTLLKWLFTLGVLLTLPVAYTEFTQINWGQLPISIIGAIVFVIMGTTFLTYLCNLFALRQLRASTLSAFTYLQPLIGILYAVFSGQDQLTILKVGATITVLVGVFLTSQKPQPKAKEHV